MKTTTPDYRAQLYDMIRHFTDDVHAAYMANPYQRLYWYYLPAIGTAWGDFQFATEDDEPQRATAWQLANTEPIPRHLTRDQLEGWITTIARRLPIIGT